MPMRKLAMNRLLVGVLPALALLLAPAPAAAQDGSLRILLSLSSHRVRSSQTEALDLGVEFRNQLKEPLRWHPPQWLFSDEQRRSRVCIERTDGRRFLATGIPGEDGLSCLTFSATERTEVLPPARAAFWSSPFGSVVEADAEWWIAFDDETWEPRYHGSLPPGAYDVWVEFHDGPPRNGPFLERAPASALIH